MARDEKLVRKMRQSPRSIRFEEMDGLFAAARFCGDSARNVPRSVSAGNGVRFSVVKPRGGKTAVNQNAVKEILKRLEL